MAKKDKIQDLDKEQRGAGGKILLSRFGHKKYVPFKKCFSVKKYATLIQYFKCQERAIDFDEKCTIESI